MKPAISPLQICAMGLTLLLLGCSLVAASDHDHWDLEAAQKQAAAEGKTVVVEFSSPTCRYCKHFQMALDNKQAEVMDALADVVLVQVNRDTSRGKQLAMRYGTLAVPTFIVLNKDLEPVARVQGYNHEFPEQLRRALTKTLTVPERVQAYQKDPDPQTAYELGRILRAQDDFAGALAMFDDVGAFGDERITDLQQQILMTMIDQELDFPGTYPSAFLDTYAQAVYHERCESKWRVTGMMWYYGEETGRPRLYNKYFRDFVNHARDDYGIDVRTHPRYAKIRYRIALQIDGDVDKAARLFPTSYPDDWRDQFIYVLYYAYWLVDHYVLLEEARELAHQALAMAPDLSSRSDAFYVLALIENGSGDLDMATRLIEEALAADPGNDSLHDEYACYLEMQEREQAKERTLAARR